MCLFYHDVIRLFWKKFWKLKVQLQIFEFWLKGVQNIKSKFWTKSIACVNHTFFTIMLPVVGIFGFWKKFWNFQKSAKLKVTSKFSIFNRKVLKQKVLNEQMNIFRTPTRGLKGPNMFKTDTILFLKVDQKDFRRSF